MDPVQFSGCAGDSPRWGKWLSVTAVALVSGGGGWQLLATAGPMGSAALAWCRAVRANASCLLWVQED